jgi:hypothetical protein
MQAMMTPRWAASLAALQPALSSVGVIGGAVGLTLGAAIDPAPDRAVTYVQEQPVERNVIIKERIRVASALPDRVVAADCAVSFQSMNGALDASVPTLTCHDRTPSSPPASQCKDL